MWTVWHASCQAERTPVELNESADRFPFRLALIVVVGGFKSRKIGPKKTQPEVAVA